ncbi:chromosome segregation protein [compost metagenome]
MWISKIYLRNVKTHKDSHIKLQPGLNILCGESNTGKSNIGTGALQWMFSEIVATPTHLIGPWSDSCSVVLELVDTSGKVIVLEKHSELEGRKNVFVLNGRKLYPNANKIPPDIKKLNPFTTISVNGNSYTPQIYKQGAPYYMMDSNQVDRISLCLWGTDALPLESIKRDTQKEADKYNKTLQEKRSALEEIEENIEALSFVSLWRNKLTLIKAKMPIYNKIVDSIKQIEELTKELNIVEGRLSSFPDRPSISELDAVIDKYEVLKNTKHLENELIDNINKYDQLNGPWDITTLDLIISKFEHMRNVNTYIDFFENNIKEVNRQTSTVSVSILDKVIQSLEEALEKEHLANQLIDIENQLFLMNLPDPKEVDNLILAVEDHLRKEQLAAELLNTDAAILLTDQSIKDYEEQIGKIEIELSDIDTCPVCGQTVEEWAEHVEN